MPIIKCGVNDNSICDGGVSVDELVSIFVLPILHKYEEPARGHRQDQRDEELLRTGLRERPDGRISEP